MPFVEYPTRGEFDLDDDGPCSLHFRNFFGDFPVLTYQTFFSARAIAKASLLRLFPGSAILLFLLCASGCVTDNRHRMIVSVPDQKMIVLRDGKPLTQFPVSTSKFGVGDRPGSYATPLGVLRVKEKSATDSHLAPSLKAANPLARSCPWMHPVATPS